MNSCKEKKSLKRTGLSWETGTPEAYSSTIVSAITVIELQTNPESVFLNNERGDSDLSKSSTEKYNSGSTW